MKRPEKQSVTEQPEKTTREPTIMRVKFWTYKLKDVPYLVSTAHETITETVETFHFVPVRI